MKIKDITETGFYIIPEFVNTEDEQIFEVIENTDKVWLKEEPNAKLLVDCWYFDHIEDNVKIFQTEGNLQTLYFDLANIDVEKTDRRFEVFGNMGAFLREIKNEN